MSIPKRRNDVAQAVRNIRRSADDGNTRGFMLAYVDNTNFGFNFFVRDLDFSAALYLVQHQKSLSEHLCAFQGGADTVDSFAERFLQTSAKRMQVDYEQLMTHFAARTSEWRFQPWEDGKPGVSQDNDRIWRNRLWPLVLSIVQAPLQCLKDMPAKVRASLIQQLRAHATEGMIVLDR